MIDFPILKQEFSRVEIENLKEMIRAFEPVEIAVNKLSDRYLTLLMADAVLRTTLEQDGGRICLWMKDALEKRFKERRPSALIDAYDYLHNPDFFSNTNYEFGVFKPGSGTKREARDTVKKLYLQLHPATEDEESDDSESVQKFVSNKLELIYQNLGAIQCTSVEAERAFYACAKQNSFSDE